MKKYRKEYAKKLMEYTKLIPYDENRIKTLVQNGIPSLTKFAYGIGVSRHTLDLWAQENKTFALAMEEAKYRICDMIEDAAAFKYTDPTFSKYMLTEKYGQNEEGEGTSSPFELNLTVVK